ncbi:MAG TPA: hypothetical protein VGI03_12235 [Verrucomicrobiae bacterium]|jgi:hypothetical protein
MIAYRITKTQLEALIESETPGWLQKAAVRTAVFRQKGYYEEKSTIWGEVKGVYMRLQGNCKCAYCERKLESIDLGKVEQDVEHFRPKGGIRAWKLPKSLTNRGVMATAVPAEGRGYFLLPYHPFNYSAACKPCNSALKKDFFPIAGKYDLDGDDPTKLTKEKPFLICPVGDFDVPAENLIQFHGVSPQPVATNGHDRERALVTIEFFKLDDTAKRKNLLRERAAIILAIYPQLEKLANGATGFEKTDAQQIVNGFSSTTSAHTNCVRSFKALFERDRDEAKEVFDQAVKLITSIS